MKQVTARVADKQDVLPGLSRTHARSPLGSQVMWLDCPEISQEASPGQFVMVRCGDCVLPRPLSLHQVRDGQIALFFTAWEEGRGTIWLSQRRIGDNVELLGPLGNGFAIKSTSRNLLLVAGGIGIAPLVFLTQEAARRGHAVKLLQGVSTASQLYPGHLLPSEIEFLTAAEDGTAGERGMITDFLPDYIGWADQVFACGPVAMYRAMATQAVRQTKSVQVSLEVRMGCGVGGCYGCTIKTRQGLKQVCKDGPVFDLDDILWDELT